MLTQAKVHWIELDAVDSTNNHLHNAYTTGAMTGVCAVLANSQTHGRGRAGRVWRSEPGQGLCLSVGLPFAGHTVPCLPLLVGLSVAKVLERLAVPVRLKWPNDLLVGQHKLGGILCESFQGKAGPVTVVGVGVNLKQPALSSQSPEAVEQWSPTALSLQGGEAAAVSASKLARLIVAELLLQLDAFERQGGASLVEEFMVRDAWLGQSVKVLDDGQPVVSGKAMGINEQGAYLLETDAGLHAVHSGDLSLRKLS